MAQPLGSPGSRPIDSHLHSDPGIGFDAKLSMPDATTVRVTPQGETSMSNTTAKTVVVFNEYRPGKAHYYDLTREQNLKLTQYYTELRQRIMPVGGRCFVVNFSKQTASYIDKNDEKRVVFLDDRDPQKARTIHAYAREAEHLISKELYHGNVRNQSFQPGDKGSSMGDRPLVRPKGSPAPDFTAVEQAQILDKIPAAKRAAAIQHMQQACQLLENLKDDYQQAISADDGSDSQRKQLLDAKLHALNAVDEFALYAAVAHYPVDDPRLAPQAAKQLREIVFEQMGKGFESYAIDVGGLIFAGRGAEGRLEYGNYCEEMGIRMKRDGLEDRLVRGVLAGDFDALDRWIGEDLDDLPSGGSVDDSDGEIEIDEGGFSSSYGGSAGPNRQYGDVSGDTSNDEGVGFDPFDSENDQ